MANPSPALTGLPVLYGVDVFGQDTVAKLPLGSLAFAYGGNKAFRYARNNASSAAVAANIQVTQIPEANHENKAVTTAAAIDSLSVTFSVGATAAAKDLYAEGELCVNDAIGEGISYRIVGNTAFASSGSGTVYLAEPIQVALTTASEVTMLKNPWDRFVISVADQLDMVVGVANKAIAVDLYAFLQTRGVCSVLADETIAVGSAVVTGSSVVGSVETADTDDITPFLGIAIEAAVDTEERLIYLTID